MRAEVPAVVLLTVWMALFLGFLGGVLMRPGVDTVMAGGAATIVLLKIAYDYLYHEPDTEPDVEKMFE